MSGGVPDDVPAWWDVSSDDFPIIERRYRILRENLADPPGSPIGEFSYSNAGYTVAAAMAEKLTGQSWETLMEERLFAPLGMASAGFGAPNTPHEVDQPWSHRRDSAGVWIPAQLGYGGSLAPAGNVYCSLEDYAKFVALQFPHKRPTILDREQLNELLIPSTSERLRRRLGCLAKGRSSVDRSWWRWWGVLWVLCGYQGSPKPRARIYSGRQFPRRRRFFTAVRLRACSTPSLIA